MKLAVSGFVYVVLGEMQGDELYVFDDLDAAERFCESRGGDPRQIREEPVLGMDFSKQAAEQSA